jgi:hypothetical protein
VCEYGILGPVSLCGKDTSKKRRPNVPKAEQAIMVAAEVRTEPALHCSPRVTQHQFGQVGIREPGCKHAGVWQREPTRGPFDGKVSKELAQEYLVYPV